jgi:ketosteroid isomerase-like protein
MSNEAILAADALGAAIKARSAEQVRAIYADDIVVWHGSTGQSMGKDENAGLLAGVFKLTRRMEYINIRRDSIENGVVEQHQLVATFADGTEVPTLEVCLILKVRDGLITRIEEYFDGQTYAEVWRRLAAL